MPFYRIKTTTNAGARRRAAPNNRIVVSVPAHAAQDAALAPGGERTFTARTSSSSAHARAAWREAQNQDVCSQMFEICRRCQDDHLARWGAVCMFDVDSGNAPAWVIDTLRGIIEMTMADIASDLSSRMPGAAIGVTLRRSGGFWALAIAENISGAHGPARAARRLAMVRALTDRIACVSRALPNPKGCTIAIAIPLADEAAAAAARTLH